MKKRIYREVIRLELGGKVLAKCTRVPGPHPYITVTTDAGFVGAVPDRSIKKLKRWCEEILQRRSTRDEIEKMREALKYYSHPDHYEGRVTMAGRRPPGVLADGGRIAREALSTEK